MKNETTNGEVGPKPTDNIPSLPEPAIDKEVTHDGTGRLKSPLKAQVFKITGGNSQLADEERRNSDKQADETEEFLRDLENEHQQINDTIITQSLSGSKRASLQNNNTLLTLEGSRRSKDYSPGIVGSSQKNENIFDQPGLEESVSNDTSMHIQESNEHLHNADESSRNKSGRGRKRKSVLYQSSRPKRRSSGTTTALESSSRVPEAIERNEELNLHTGMQTGRNSGRQSLLEEFGKPLSQPSRTTPSSADGSEALRFSVPETLPGLPNVDLALFKSPTPRPRKQSLSIGRQSESASKLLEPMSRLDVTGYQSLLRSETSSPPSHRQINAKNKRKQINGESSNQPESITTNEHYEPNENNNTHFNDYEIDEPNNEIPANEKSAEKQYDSHLQSRVLEKEAEEESRIEHTDEELDDEPSLEIAHRTESPKPSAPKPKRRREQAPRQPRMEITVHKIPKQSGGTSHINAIDMVLQTTEDVFHDISRQPDSEEDENDLGGATELPPSKGFNFNDIVNHLADIQATDEASIQKSRRKKNNVSKEPGVLYNEYENAPILRSAMANWRSLIRTRLLSLVDLLDNNFIFEREARKAKMERDELRQELLSLRQQRLDVEEKIDQTRTQFLKKQNELDCARKIDRLLSTLEEPNDQSEASQDEDEDEENQLLKKFPSQIESVITRLEWLAPLLNDKHGLLDTLHLFNDQLTDVDQKYGFR